jgi:hypothetical protein
MLKQLIYASQEARPMQDEDLIRILVGARERNLQHNITGLLVYKNGLFLQAIEGEEEDMEVVWEVIQNDVRHGNIVLLLFHTLEERDFPDWKMGFLNMSEPGVASIEGYSRFLEETFLPEQLAAKPGQALGFLLAVKQSGGAQSQ